MSRMYGIVKVMIKHGFNLDTDYETIWPFLVEYDGILFNEKDPDVVTVYLDGTFEEKTKKDEIKDSAWDEVLKRGIMLKLFNENKMGAELVEKEKEVKVLRGVLAEKEKENQELRGQKEKDEKKENAAVAKKKADLMAEKKASMKELAKKKAELAELAKKELELANACMKEMAENEAELADARAALVGYENYEFNPAAYNRYVKEMSIKNSVFEEELCALKAEMKEMKAEHAAALAPYEWVVNRTPGLKDMLKKFKGKR